MTKEEIKEEILDKVFINRTENNRLNQDFCEESMDLLFKKFEKIIDEFPFSDNKEGNIEIRRELKLKIK